VDEASDGRDALEKVSATRFDAILLDLVMPNVSGWEFRETQLRHAELASIPTVIVTVQPLREQDRFTLRTPHVVMKPFDDRGLLTVLNRAMPPRAELASPASTPSVVDPNALYWSRRGTVACGLHAPHGNSEEWRDDRWTAIPAGSAKHGLAYQCQYCPGRKGPIRHGKHTEPA
jgi:two-component system response regulator MprA